MTIKASDSDPETPYLLPAVLKLSSFSAEAGEPVPALPAPLKYLPSHLHGVSVINTVNAHIGRLMATGHDTFSLASLLLFLPSHLAKHTRTHTSTGSAQMDVSFSGAESCGPFMKIHGAISPRTEVALLTYCTYCVPLKEPRVFCSQTLLFPVTLNVLAIRSVWTGPRSRPWH